MNENNNNSITNKFSNNRTMQFNYLLQSSGRKHMSIRSEKLNMTDELELLRNVQKALTPITTDDVVTNAYKLSAFAIIVNAIKHQWELQHENNKRI